MPGDQKGARVWRQQEADTEEGPTPAGPGVLGGGAAAGCWVMEGQGLSALLCKCCV